MLWKRRSEPLSPPPAMFCVQIGMLFSDGDMARVKILEIYLASWIVEL